MRQKIELNLDSMIPRPLCGCNLVKRAQTLQSNKENIDPKTKLLWANRSTIFGPLTKELAYEITLLMKESEERDTYLFQFTKEMCEDHAWMRNPEYKKMLTNLAGVSCLSLFRSIY